ncbi:Hpt domain-containing protein [Arcobacter caeni]|uniref:Hpt domain-containing protein n=1 Tax=Arcobacter caeni TaxID=1912877 RepID=UPI001D1711E3|nr:Hpt domain-containing protein [Arcobacter caeni]
MREAHTLKGLCGNIGADLLFEKAKELEFHLKEKGFDDKTNVLIKSLEINLKYLIENIKKVVDVSFSNKNNKNFLEKNNVDMLKIDKLFIELEQLLNELDSNALIKANELHNELEKLEYLTHLDNFMNVVSDFDFDKASEYLKLLKNEVQKNKR